MFSDVYIQKILTSIISNYNTKDDNFVFIKHYNNLGFSGYDIVNMLGGNKDVYLLCHEFSRSQMQEPYEPFLGWVSDIYYNIYANTMTVEEFIDSCNVYSLQKSVFVSYIKTGKCTRSDDVIISEISFEKLKFYNSLLNIYKTITQKVKILLVLNNVHFAHYSTISFLHKMMNLKSMSNLAVFAAYNESYIHLEYMNEIWDKFVQYIKANNYVYDWVGIDDKKAEIIDDMFLVNSKRIDEYILKLNNMLQTFAIEQAEVYIDVIYQKMEFENLKIPKVQKRKLLYLYAMINIYNGLYNKALVACENVKLLYTKTQEPMEHYIATYIMGMAFIYMSQFKSAYKCAKECINIATKNLRDDFYIFKGELLHYMVQYYGWNDIIVHNLKFEAKPEFLEKLEYYGYKNVLAHMYVYGVDKNKATRNDIPEVYEALYTPEYLKRGMDLGYELGNDSILIIAYMNNIELFRGLNNFKFIEQIYKECIKILAKNNDKVQIASMYNGIGYNCSIVEKYVQADTYYNESLNIFYETDNIEFMGETLYNMSLNCIQAGDYKKGLDYVLAAIKIAEDLELNGYRICKDTKLFGMAALCYYYLGSEYNCYVYFSKMECIVKYLLDSLDDSEVVDYWSGELVLYFFIKGLITKKNGEYDVSKEAFEKALHIAIHTDSFKVYIYPLLILELGRLFKNLNQIEIAREILNEGIYYCNQNGYYERQNMLQDELTGKEITTKKINFTLNGITLKDILEKSSDFAVEKQLKNRLNDINFISQWQDRLDRESSSIEEVVVSSMKTLQNNFSFDSVYYLKAVDGELKLIYSDDDRYLSNSEVSIIGDYFDKNRSAFVSHRTEKSFGDYEQILSVFGESNVFSMVGIPIMDNDRVDAVFIGLLLMHRTVYSNKKVINQNNFVILKYVFGQFIDTIERLRAHEEIERMNKALEEMASTDLLTGLLNRQGFMTSIKNLDVQDGSENIVMYIDLDNFKYYNDTVGHEIGDLVLVLFANILQNLANDDGLAIRYGGDEFLLIFKDKNEDYAIDVAKSIYNQIEDGFASNIEKRLNKKIEIPEEKRLSCCIGISTFSSCEDAEIEKALDRADEALYSVKNTTKHNYKVWKDETRNEKN